MPLYEFECKSCKNNLMKALGLIEKKHDKKSLLNIIKKYKNLNGIQIIDLKSEKLIQSEGAREEADVEIDLYIEEGKKMVLFYATNFRFSELIFDEEDEKKISTNCCKKGEIESSWYEIDAKNAVVGRLATIISKIIRGKNKNTFTPHMDHGDFVVVNNI